MGLCQGWTVAQSLQPPIAYLIFKIQCFLQAKFVFNPCCHPGELCVQARPCQQWGKKNAKKEEFYLYFIVFENSKY